MKFAKTLLGLGFVAIILVLGVVFVILKHGFPLGFKQHRSGGNL